MQTETNLSGFRTLALGIVLFAGLLSLSRGGLLVMLLAASISVAVCYRAKRLKIRFVASLAGVAVLIGVLLAVHGLDQVSDRMGQMSSASAEQLDAGAGRRTIWAAVYKATADFALLGSGVGSHPEVYPMYLEDPPEREFTHAENSPLQTLLETGVVGLTLVVAGIGFCGFWCLGGLRRADSSRMLVCVGAVSASLAVSVVHGLADFVWYVPACMVVVAILAGCTCRAWQLAGVAAGIPSQRVGLPKPVAMAAVVLLLAAGTWMIGNRVGPTMAEPHWDCYRIVELASDNPTAAEQQKQAEETPDELYEDSLKSIDRMIAELEQVLAYDPQNARAHLDLVAAYLKRFDHNQQRAENAMSLADIRDATAQARNTAKDQQQRQQVEQWLARVLGMQGDDLRLALEHTRRGLALCPLQGEGYLYLAELRFLEGPDSETIRSAYLDQALRVRPFEGSVLFEVGRAAIDRAVRTLNSAKNAPSDSKAIASFQQEFGRGLAYWRQSFRGGRTHQKRLIEALAGRVPVAYFVESFQPDLDAMRMLRAAYCWLAQPEQVGRVYQLYANHCRAEGYAVQGMEAAAAWLEAEMAQLHADYAKIAHAKAEELEGKKAAAVWLETAWFYHVTDDRQQAFECSRKAYRLNPNDYEIRYNLARRLIEQKQYEEAEDHLKWCARRRPDNQKLQMLVRETAKNRISQQARSTYQAKKLHTLR